MSEGPLMPMLMFGLIGYAVCQFLVALCELAVWMRT